MTLSQLVQEAAENADEAGYPQVNYGKLVIEPIIIKWGKKGETPARTPMTEGYVQKDGENIELVFKVLISELNPKIDFDYERNSLMRKSGDNQLTDWTETIEPSLIEVFGENWAEPAMKQPYVLVEAVGVISGKRSDSGKMYDVPKFLEVFPSKEACFAAHAARFSGGGSAPVATEIPQDIVTQAKGLVASVGSDVARTMFASNAPFNAYDVNALMAKVHEV